MSDAYERERQNNSRLSELSAKVTALRGVTVDIYDNARSQDVIDNTVCFSFLAPRNPTSTCRFSTSRTIRTEQSPFNLKEELKC